MIVICPLTFATDIKNGRFIRILRMTRIIRIGGVVGAGDR